MREKRQRQEMAFIGRDHNPEAFTLWMAGGGVKAGLSNGSTDEMGYQAVVDKVCVHDFRAAVLALLRFDHLRFIYPINGVPMRLRDVTKPVSKSVPGLMA